MSEYALPRKLNSAQAASRRFSDAARDYDHHARVQKHSAQHLCQWLDQMLPLNFKPNACVDVGSGTGFLTEHLLNKFPQSAVHAVDLAQGMLTELKRKYPTERLHTHLLTLAFSVQHRGFQRAAGRLISSLGSGARGHWANQRFTTPAKR